jgi:hypothetical protein
MSVTLVVLGILASLGVGFGAGWGLKPDDASKALEAQAVTLKELSEGQAKLVEGAARPIVIDAELKATLAEIPVQCRKDMGGDPNTAMCMWATCLQFGQSSAQRPECRQVEQIMVDTLKARIPEAEKP